MLTMMAQALGWYFLRPGLHGPSVDQLSVQSGLPREVIQTLQRGERDATEAEWAALRRAVPDLGRPRTPDEIAFSEKYHP